jgi:hypothetical protein
MEKLVLLCILVGTILALANTSAAWPRRAPPRTQPRP